MGTVNINGKQFVGNNIAIRDGKVVIDGKLQDVVLNGDVEAAGDGKRLWTCGMRCLREL